MSLNRSQPKTPVPIVASPVGSSVPETPAARPTFMSRLSWLGGKVLDVAESIGEGVVSILGLDDSHFQDVLDNMTEEEMAAAIEVNEQRTQEYKDAGILTETELPPDLTVEDIGVDLYSVTGPQAGSYRQVNRGTSNEDIENGVQMQPTRSIQRTDDDFANTNPFNPNLHPPATTTTDASSSTGTAISDSPHTAANTAISASTNSPNKTIEALDVESNNIQETPDA